MWRVMVFVLFALRSNAHFNFFITQEELNRLIGITTDYFYVQRGQVNTYALNFTMLIPANISDIHFSWESLANYSIPYIMAVEYDGKAKGALQPPQMNISSTGVIPTSVQTFRIRLVCTGAKSAEIAVNIYVNVSSNKHSKFTVLHLRRNKICLKGIGSTIHNDLSVRLGPETASSLYVAVASALTMITLVVITTSAVCIKNKKVRSQEPHYMTAIYDNNQHVFVRLGSTLGRPSSAESGSYATIGSIEKCPPSPSPYATSDACRVSYYASSQVMHLAHIGLQDPRLSDPSKRVRALAAPRSTLYLDQVTEDGIFGQVFRGTFKSQDVTIKTTKETASKRQISLFLSEGTMMFGLEHKNVLTVLAVNVDSSKQPFVVYPYANRGNLKRFLVKCRQREESHYNLSTQSLVDIAIQILLGVMYLHGQCICHKDLAARNCVIDEKLQVKITDNCLARDLFPNDYFCLGDNESRPVKWLALESLLYKQYTGPSDVWSFGIILWELTTRAQQPYPEIDPFEMGTYLRNGYRLAQPMGCPDELFAIMAYCWLANPTERPQASQLLTYLQDFYTALCRFI